jgi:hypothetical protein
MDSEPGREKLSKRLLGYVIANPKHVITLGVATGFAVAYGLILRARRDVIEQLWVSPDKTQRAAELVMRCWMDADRIGAIEDLRFDQLLDDITTMVRAS